jgi:hypothetical protein
MDIIKEIKILITLFFLTIEVMVSAFVTVLFFNNLNRIRKLSEGNPDVEYHSERLLAEYYNIVYGESEKSNIDMQIYDPNNIYRPGE